MHFLLLIHITFGSISLTYSLLGIKHLFSERITTARIFKILGISFLFSFISGLVLVVASFSDGHFLSHCAGLGFYTAWIGSVEFLLWRKLKQYNLQYLTSKKI